MAAGLVRGADPRMLAGWTRRRIPRPPGSRQCHEIRNAHSTTGRWRRTTSLRRLRRRLPDGRARRLLVGSTQYGPNEASESPGVTRLGVLWSQLRSPLLLLLLFAAAVSILTGEWTDAVIVLAIVVASVGIGYSREYRAQTAAAELRTRVRVQTRRTARRRGTSPVPVARGRSGRRRAARRPAASSRRTCCCSRPPTASSTRRSSPGESFPVEKHPGRSAAMHRSPAAPTVSISAPTCAAAPRAASSSRTGRATAFGAIAHRLTLRPPETEFDRGLRHFGYLLTSAMP